MSGVIAKIKSIYNSLTDVDLKLADFIIDNKEKVPYQTVYQIAALTEVSVPSVSRFVRKLGYGNFKDFKVELAKDDSTSVLDIYSAINKEDSIDEIVRKVFFGNMKALEDTWKLLAASDLANCAKTISETKRIVFIGVGGSGAVATDAALRFSHLDIQAEGYIDPIQIMIQARRLKKNEILVAISHSGRTSFVIEALKAASANGVITLSISNYLNSVMKEISRYFFCTAFEENSVKVAALSSHISQICIIDALYLLTAFYKKKLWDVEKLNSEIEKSLRIKY
ncbi:MAG: MurR/RpiR family transcriptional regulator [Saccharofermentanales bacterium]